MLKQRKSELLFLSVMIKSILSSCPLFLYIVLLCFLTQNMEFLTHLGRSTRGWVVLGNRWWKKEKKKNPRAHRRYFKKWSRPHATVSARQTKRWRCNLWAFTGKKWEIFNDLFACRRKAKLQIKSYIFFQKIPTYTRPRPKLTSFSTLQSCQTRTTDLC